MTRSRTTLTYLDAGVLIVGVRGTPDDKLRAHALISSPALTFVASGYLMLEVLPKAVYFKHKTERKFYEDYFDMVSVWSRPSTDDAYVTACKYGLAAVDALHLQSALDAGADVMITTEKSTKPLYRARGIRVIDFSTL